MEKAILCIMYVYHILSIIMLVFAYV